jgi:NADH-quinone oxidoreductase subunit M
MGATESLGSNAWIYTAFATSGVILAAIYLLWMFQRVFMGPLDNPENRKLRDVNRRELAIFLAFILFIVWIGIYPNPYFEVMDATVERLVGYVGSAAMAMR